MFHACHPAVNPNSTTGTEMPLLYVLLLNVL